MGGWDGKVIGFGMVASEDDNGLDGIQRTVHYQVLSVQSDNVRCNRPLLSSYRLDFQTWFVEICQ